jgi:hypothetical protein
MIDTTKQGGCPQCHWNWNRCKCPSWPLRFIQFARPQIMWMLSTNFSFEGTAGFTDEKVSSSRQDSAVFESVSCIVAEVEARLKICGKAGERLLINFLVARPDSLVFDCLSDEGKAVMNYISGICRRINSCDKCSNKSCKRRGRRPCTFAQFVSHNR